ncbi:MAG: aldo/keto reductase [Gemmataceae bacterium]|nr:aldo/keto reductase [Gemmataceae bacterium]
MKRRMLRCGIEVSEIGLGCWAIGGPFWDRGGWMGYGDVDDAESLRCLRRALDLGVTFFDTADVYGCGHSEALLGEAFGDRPDVVVSTKFGFVFDCAERKVTGQDAGPEAMRRSLEGSLRRLRRERIDQYGLQLWDYPLERAGEVLEALDRFVDEGKVRSYAWLTDDLERVKWFAAHGKHVVGAPQLLNVLENSPPLLAWCEEQGMPALARRPLCMGLLTGKFDASSTFPENDMRKRFGWNFGTGKQATWLRKLEALRGILTRDGRTLAQGSLCWVWGRSRLAMPCPGFKNLKQLEENVAAERFGPLPAEQMAEIAAVLA